MHCLHGGGGGRWVSIITHFSNKSANDVVFLLTCSSAFGRVSAAGFQNWEQIGVYIPDKTKQIWIWRMHAAQLHSSLRNPGL